MDDETIDDLWIKEYKEKEEKYNDFYKEKVSNIKINFFYVNLENKLVSIKEDIIYIEDGNLKKDLLIKLIKNNENIKYKLTYLLKYNFTLDSDKVLDFCNDNDITENYLTSIKNIDDINFNDTVCIFNDINCLFMIYTEKNTIRKDNTRRININSKIRKTRRKRT
jgi:hypothetical protein